MKNEIWKSIPSIPGAFASSIGRVWFPPKRQEAQMPGGGKRIYKTAPRLGSEEKASTGRKNSGRRMIVHRLGKTYKVHRLVCEAFHGPPPSEKHIVLHLNEEPTDNRPENLRWGTRKENQNFPKAKAAFKARSGQNSTWAIHKKRKAKDPNYQARPKPKN
jgi:hypothetical protein